MAKRKTQLDRAIEYTLAEIARLGDPDKLPLPVRTVLIVHSAQGAIDNGGLQYFFESDWPDQPAYSTFIDAYRAIGATTEADALRAAVALFPFANPHKHQSRRDKFLEKFLDEPGSPFEPYTNQLCGNKTIWQLLAKYVSAHPGAFPKSEG